MIRKARFNRETRETNITAYLKIEGSGQHRIETPIGFFTHLLESFAFHGRFDLNFSAKGDLNVDQHHLVEDCGLVLGRLFGRALGKAKGINRAGFFIMPMDEALAIVSIDLCGRPYLQYDVKFRRRLCGKLDTDTLPDFFQAFASGVMGNIVIKTVIGRSDHHKAEATFKAFGRALRLACSLDPREVKAIAELPSSLKGVID